MDHIIRIDRFIYSKDTTIGKLYVNNIFFCYTLEDTVRPYGIKVKKHTAIPDTKIGYNVGIHLSNKFGRNVLILHTESDKVTLKANGIEFGYVYFHGGNKHTDTEACGLVASAYHPEDMTIQGSMERALFDMISDWLEAGEKVTCYVNNLTYHD